MDLLPHHIEESIQRGQWEVFKPVAVLHESKMIRNNGGWTMMKVQVKDPKHNKKSSYYYLYIIYIDSPPLVLKRDQWGPLEEPMAAWKISN